jgi:uncharacterized protein (DUF2384 family)
MLAVQLEKSIPVGINDSQLLQQLQDKSFDGHYLQALKEVAPFNDEEISLWLNINVKTFRTYKKPNQELNIGLREHVLSLLSLMKHGKKLFGTNQDFKTWLTSDNFYLDNKAPVEFLQTITGIRFVDERLTAMEYGDNI